MTFLLVVYLLSSAGCAWFLLKHLDSISEDSFSLMVMLMILILPFVNTLFVLVWIGDLIDRCMKSTSQSA